MLYCAVDILLSGNLPAFPAPWTAHSGDLFSLRPKRFWRLSFPGSFWVWRYSSSVLVWAALAGSFPGTWRSQNWGPSWTSPWEGLCWGLHSCRETWRFEVEMQLMTYLGRWRIFCWDSFLNKSKTFRHSSSSVLWAFFNFELAFFGLNFVKCVGQEVNVRTSSHNRLACSSFQEPNLSLGARTRVRSRTLRGATYPDWHSILWDLIFLYAVCTWYSQKSPYSLQSPNKANETLQLFGIESQWRSGVILCYSEIQNKAEDRRLQMSRPVLRLKSSID